MCEKYLIRELKEPDIRSALNLIWNVFEEFESPDYCAEGIKSFHEFIEYNSIIEKVKEKSIFFWGCFDCEKLIGVLAIRDLNHICMLFVDKNYHKCGVAKKLMAIGVKYCTENIDDLTEVTVNSSPYAVEVYHKLGFKNTNAEQIVNGIRFTPMKLSISN
ncbi:MULTISPECIES: GNAT family N-acetyltransferase [unclassified Clostridioides]|uniref:GNAT family N-acetyltransferase n=1 Tax=unclassified Clostridioides TaxID=2635829 RepID=UPI001D10CC3B|nr:GNAT family N-acetyltransferase [Clostridioides sp. ES-S-0001-02]MCC0702215.1 GNAT family N-acetyltransferase [Clostridioides sp. ES-S-0049-02]